MCLLLKSRKRGADWVPLAPLPVDVNAFYFSVFSVKILWDVHNRNGWEVTRNEGPLPPQLCSQSQKGVMLPSRLTCNTYSLIEEGFTLERLSSVFPIIW